MRNARYKLPFIITVFVFSEIQRKIKVCGLKFSDIIYVTYEEFRIPLQE